MKKVNAHSTFLADCNGFTLIELIAVLVVMSVMATIAIRKVIALVSSDGIRSAASRLAPSPGSPIKPSKTRYGRTSR